MHTSAEDGAHAGAITEAYPLSPLQQGMLFNALLDPRSGVDIKQVLCELRETLDVAAFQRAWRSVVACHPVLRTSFRWEELSEPRQEVRAQVELAWEEEDWRGIAAGERDERIAELLDADRRRGFELTRAPLYRLTLLRTGEAEFRLIWTLHQALLDGRSCRSVLQEVFARYESIREGRDVPAVRHRPYRDYIDWLRRQDFSKDESYWRETLKGLAGATPLTVERGPGGGRGGARRKSTEEVLLPAHATTALRELARDAQLTLNTFVQGAWALLLSRYSGEADVVFGVIRTNRRFTIEGMEDMIGLFLNTLPLRVRVDSSAPLIPWLKQVRAQWIEMRAHAHAPLAHVQAWSRRWAGGTLFHSTVMFESCDLDTFLRNQGGAWQSRRFSTYSQTNYTLDLAAIDGPELALRIDFDRERIERAAAGRMARHVRTLLEAMAANPRQTLGELPLLSESERHKLLFGWSGTATGPPPQTPMHALFEAQAARTPEAVAVRSGGRALSYGDLDRRANQLAHALRKRGVGAEVLVGLCMNRGFGMVIALLGVLKAGGAYVPFDPDYPPGRLAFMLEDCGAKLVLTEESLVGTLSPLPPACEVMLLDREAEALAVEPREAPRVKVDPSSPAYAIFTSGSTGKPKAALLTHGGLANLAASEFRLYGVGPQSRVLEFSSLSFDASLSEIAMALCSGAALYVEERSIILPGPELESYLEREQITVLSLTPSALAVIDPAAGPHLEQVIVGGEACPAELAERWAGRCRFFNTYGPTEATIVTTYVEYRDGSGPPNIGRPLPNVRVYVLDQALRPVPVGVRGELFIGGVGVACGYINRPQLSAERFVPDPFSTAPGARLYRTGDLARWRDDGQVEFIGRLDDQVKLRGFRIELGEIEANLASHPALREAVVIVREDVPGDPRLVAYVVPREGEIGAAELKQHLSHRLPAHMVPSAFVTLQALPRTPNAKLDRKALPAPERTGSEAAYTAPRSPTEEAVAASWRKALRLERIGIQDNFFELGGHSLTFVRMISEINSAFKIRLGMAELIRNPTVEQFAGLIDARQPSHRRLSTVVLLQEGRAELPMYLIYAGPGELRLAQHMGGSHQVFGIEAHWPMAWREAVAQNRTAEFPSLEQVVEPYVAELSAHAGSSPCVLAGFSYAGRIAFEAAHQLHKRGGKVECVVLIDIAARPVNRYKLAWQIWRQDWKQSTNGSSTHGVLRSLGSRMKSTWDTSWWLLGKARKRLRSYFNRPEVHLETLSGVLDGQGMPVPWALLDRLYGEMDKTYRFRRLDCRGVLFRTGEFDGKQISYAADDALGWENLFSGGVEVIPVAGHHFSIWGRQIPTIALEINRVLGRRSPNEREATGRGHQEMAGAFPPWKESREGGGWWPGYTEWQSEYKRFKKEAEARGIRISSE